MIRGNRDRKSFQFFLNFFKHLVLQLWRSSGSPAHTEVRLHLDWPDLNSAEILEKPPRMSKVSSLQAAFISLRWKMFSAETTMRPEHLINMIPTHTEKPSICTDVFFNQCWDQFSKLRLFRQCWEQFDKRKLSPSVIKGYQGFWVQTLSSRTQGSSTSCYFRRCCFSHFQCIWTSWKLLRHWPCCVSRLKIECKKRIKGEWV